MIDYLTLLSRVPVTNCASGARPQGNRWVPEKYQSNKWESWLSYRSDVSFNNWLTVCKRLSESS